MCSDTDYDGIEYDAVQCDTTLYNSEIKKMRYDATREEIERSLL